MATLQDSPISREAPPTRTMAPQTTMVFVLKNEVPKSELPNQAKHSQQNIYFFQANFTHK